jgi:hypothetical protein
MARDLHYSFRIGKYQEGPHERAQRYSKRLPGKDTCPSRGFNAYMHQADKWVAFHSNADLGGSFQT